MVLCRSIYVIYSMLRQVQTCLLVHREQHAIPPVKILPGLFTLEPNTVDRLLI